MYIESGLDIGPGMEISLPPYPTTVEYLLVAGGGGGGTMAGGGGGGFLTGNYNIPAGATITTTVGAAGAAAPAPGYTTGGTGSNSSFVNDIDVAKSGSIYLNGSNQYLTNPDYASFDLGTDDFTVEGWYNFSSFASPTTMIALGNGAAYESISMAWSIIYSGGNLIFYRYNSFNSSTSGSGTFTPPVPLRTGAWYHIACTRNGSDLKMFLNGFQIGTTINIAASSYSPFNTNPLYIGSFQNNSILSNFNVSNVRVVKGVAVYTTNFTPSRTPLTSTQAANVNGYPSAAITGTQTLLLLNTVYGTDYLKDSSSYNHTITNVNSATSQTLEPIYTVTSYGGGGGGSYSGSETGGTGGSGGGMGAYQGTGSIGKGFVGQGYNGGAANQVSNYQGGGGGGAGGVGGSAGPGTPGLGGVGAISAITGTSYYWAGGGGGGSASVPGGAGGMGGGQAGLATYPGTMGTGGYNNATTSGAGTNTGAGGGGNFASNTTNPGGSGIAVFRYPAIFNAATATTGSPIYSTVDGYRVYIFTGSGSITF